MKPKDKAWKYFSEYVRRSNADSDGMVKCFTCDTIKHWKEMDAGHFCSRKHNNTFIHIVNVQPQCTYCNRYLNGNLGQFAINLDSKFGKGAAQQVINESKIPVKYSDADWNYCALEYKNMLKLLK